LWEEPAGFIASRILDEGYGELTDLRPVGAGPGFNNGWPRLSSSNANNGGPKLLPRLVTQSENSISIKLPRHISSNFDVSRFDCREGGTSTAR